MHCRLMPPFNGSQKPVIPTSEVVITLHALHWLPFSPSDVVPHATRYSLQLLIQFYI